MLAALHSVDYEALGLSDFGKSGNYFARQIGRWSKQYVSAKTDHIHSMENLMDYLPQNVPPDDTTCIVHGDYRMENMLFHPTEPKILALLDWELSTLGHPLGDLAYSCGPTTSLRPVIPAWTVLWAGIGDSHRVGICRRILPPDRPGGHSQLEFLYGLCFFPSGEHLSGCL